MFDTHCHLQFDVFAGKADTIIGNARDAGISHFLLPGVDLASSQDALQLAENFAQVYAAVGIHPTADLPKLHLEKTMFKLAEFLVHPKALAIGEIGLDYYKNTVGSVTQKAFLVAQIKLANKHGLPVVLHCRQAGADMIRALQELWNPALERNVVLHCCEADPVLFEFALAKHIFMGVCGDVTYDAAKQAFVKQIPLELLVLETDSPFLTPVPPRNTKRFPNVPANLVHTARAVAEIHKVSQQQLLAQTTANAKQLFNLT